MGDDVTVLDQVRRLARNPLVGLTDQLDPTNGCPTRRVRWDGSPLDLQRTVWTWFTHAA